MVTLQQCYRITNYTTIEAKSYAPVVPHPASLRISQRTHFQLVINDNIHVYCFNFVPLDELEARLAKGSPLSDFVGRAESITEMIPIVEKKVGKMLYLRRVTVMDERTRTVEVTLWEDKGRQVDKATALHQIVAVTATFASIFLEKVQLTSTNATMFFVDPPIPNLQDLEERFSNLPQSEAAVTQDIVPKAPIQKIVINDLHTKGQAELHRVQLSCEATITEIFSYRSWYYLSCQHCPRRVDEEMSKEGDILWRCLTHETMNKPTQPYVLNTVITDDTGSTEAVFFNTVVQQLTGISCHVLIAAKNYVDPKVLPEEIQNIQGQRKLLQLTVNVNGVVHINKIIEPQIPLTLTQPTTQITSLLQQPTTPTPKQQK